MTKLNWIFFILLFAFDVSAEIRRIEVNDYEIEYEIKGEGGELVFLEAGGSAGLADWDPVFETLANKTKVLRYSRIGNGNSEKVVKNYSSEEYAHEAFLLLSALNIKQPVVYVAHSYGAYIARVFSAAYPNHVSGLMLIEPASEHDVDIMRKIDLALAEEQIAQVKLDDLSNGMSNQYLDFWSKRPLPDYPQIPDIPLTVIASVKKYNEPSLLFLPIKQEICGANFTLIGQTHFHKEG